MDTDVEMTEVAGTSQTEVDEEPLPSVVPGSAAWHRNFPNDWLPIITRDIQRQTEVSKQLTYIKFLCILPTLSGKKRQAI